MLRRTATVFVDAPEGVVFESLQDIVGQLVASNAGLGIKHEVLVNQIGTGTQVQLTYEMPAPAWWNVAGRVVFAVRIRRRMGQELRLIKSEAERAFGSSASTNSS